MPHPALNYIKQISSDKFDPKSFINSNLADFFIQLASYFLSIHKYDKKKDQIVLSRRVKAAPIVESLEKIISNISPNDINLSMCPDIDTIFSFLLHPETPADVRIPSSILFHNLIKAVGYESFMEGLKTSFLFLIPYPQLCRNDEERNNLMRNYPKTICGFNSGGKQITYPQAHKEFVENLAFIRQLFLSGNSEFCIKFLFDDVFSFLYYNQVLAAKLDVTRTGGFSAPAPMDLHLDVLNYFQQLYKMKAPLNLFLENKEGIPILFVILNETISQKRKELAPDTFKVMNIFTDLSLLKILNDKNVLTHFLNIALSIIRVLSNDGIKYSSIEANNFMAHYLTSIDQLSGFNSESLCNTIDNLYKTIPDPHFAIFLQESVLLYILNSRNKDENLWALVISKIKENPLYATAACRFSQYIAVVCLPYLYNFQLPDTINNCKDFLSRALRNRTMNPYMFITEVIEQVINEPDKFIMNYFELGYESLSSYVKQFESYPFTAIQNPPTNKEEAMNLIRFYLPHFSDFLSYTDETQQNYIFSIFFSFYYGLFRLDKYPPNSFADPNSLFYMCEKELTKICLDEKCPDSIKYSAFSILAESINKLSVRTIIDSKSLSHWYSVLYICMLSKNEKLAELAFEHSVRTLRIGFVGSPILSPLLLSAIQLKLVPNFLSGNETHPDMTKTIIDKRIGRVPNPNEVEHPPVVSPFMKSLVNNNFTKYLTDMNYDLVNPVVSFLSMAPLFETNVNIPSEFLTEINKRYENSKHLFTVHFNEVMDLINSSNSYKDRVLQCLDLFDKNSSVITSAVILIVHEIVRESPNVSFVNELIEHLIKSITESNSVEALNMVNVLTTYIEPLMKLCSESLLKLVTSLTDEVLKITISTAPEWIYSSITSLAALFIHTYPITKNSEDSRRFCAFLSEFSNKKAMNTNFPAILFDLASSSLDLMSVYFGNFPYPLSPLYPTNVSLSKNIEHFYSVDNSLIFHTEKEEDKKIHIDMISDVGKFRWDFKSLSKEILDDNEQVGKVDIPINDETDESQQKTTEIISFFNDPICKVIADYEQQSSAEFTSDSIDDSQVPDFVNSYQNSMNKVHAGEFQSSQIRPSTETMNSAEAPLSVLNVLNFSDPSHVSRIDLSKTGKTQIEKIEGHGNRKKMKFGLVYVSQGTQDQNQIFDVKLEDTSLHFREFLTGLGWPVDLSTHTAHSGGLDVKGNRSGRTSIFYADFNNEVMFHVGPLLPTSTTDSQQVLKKRHIGNDHIYIIYVDNDVDYDPCMISSQFGLVQLMVYPLPSTGLFRVEVFSRKNEVPWFGPLRNGTIVKKEALASLLRNTAITAMANIWLQQKEFYSPILELASMIEDCSRKRAIKDNIPYIAIEDLIELH